ncbi:MAG TPA: SDR family NAD(P)-dependent oxidoreductase [Ktedonobacterales bacterium]
MRQQGGSQQDGALIVGASSGIGAALARTLAAAGYRVALVARRRDELDALCADINADSGAEPVALAYVQDVRAYEDAPALFAQIAADVAPLRVIVYAAGVLSRQAVGVDFEAERAMIETNVTGALRWLSLGAEHLERLGTGTLVGISSVAGERGRPGNGAYMASKAALTTYLDSLRYRLRGRGVQVITIKPGYVATAMTAGMPLPKPLTVSSEEAARNIAQAITRGRAVAYVPANWRPIMWVVRHLPSFAVSRLPG